MIPDTRIKWQVLSNNGDDTTTEKGIIMSPICVQEFVEQIVFPDKKHGEKSKLVIGQHDQLLNLLGVA